MNFDEAGRQYQNLVAEYSAGRLPQDRFLWEVDQLRVLGDDGLTWKIDATTGGWVWWDGQQWMAPQPQAAVVATPPPLPPASDTEPDVPQQKAPETLAELFSFLLRQLVIGLKRKIIFGACIFLGTWVFHTYLMVYVNEGFSAGSSGSFFAAMIGHLGINLDWDSIFIRPLVAITDAALATRENGSFTGSLFWMLLMSLLTGSLVRMIRTGPAAFFKKGSEMPAWVSAALSPSKGTRASQATLVFSLACGLFLSVIFGSPSFFNCRPLVFLMGLHGVSALFARLGTLTMMVVTLSWSDLQRLLKPQSPRIPISTAGAIRTHIGITAGLLLGSILPFLSFLGTLGFLFLILVGIALIVVPLINKPGGGGGGARTLLVVVFFLLSASIVLPLWADDGGWQEAGGTFGSWIGSDGAVIAIVRGLGPSLGAVAGVLAGILGAGVTAGAGAAGAVGAGAVAPGPYPTGGEPEPPELDPRDAEALAAKRQWIESRRADVKALEEEKAHLVGVMAGVQRAGFDSSEHQRRLDDINRRLAELHTQLQKEGGDISYKARSRGVIGVGKEFAEGDQIRHEREAQLEKLQRMRRVAFEEGMLEPGADGKRGDIYGKLDQIIKNLVEGKSVDPEEVGRIREHMGHRIEGISSDSSGLPRPEKPWWADGESWSDALSESSRNISTCSNSDGTISWKGMAGRVGIAILTGGGSEFVFVPAGALHTTKDAIDRGADGVEAWREGMSEAIKQELFGKVIGGVFHVGGAAVKGAAKGLAVGAEEAGEGVIKRVVKGGLKGGWGGAKQYGTQIAKEGADLVSKEGWKQAGRGLSKTLKNGASRLKNIVAGEEGLEVGFAKGGEDALVGGSKSPPIGTKQWAKQQQVRRAIATKDPDVVAGLYRDGGMKELVELQKAGHVTAAEAKGLNTLVKAEVDSAIKNGTKSSITDFQNKTGVRVKEVVVGDSGSSARGTPTRLKTDADRTLVPSFDEADVNRYAHNNNMSPEEAVDELSQKYRDVHEANVSAELRERGFGNSGDPNLQSARDNVGYGSYDRIGSGSGQSDSYAEGFTNARQAGQGTGEVYKVNPDGSVREPYKVSGQTVVDQNRLNRASHAGDPVPDDATRIPPSEVPSVLNQQTHSVAAHPDDPMTIAKAVGRSEKTANTVGESLGDSRLIQASKEIYEDPGKMDEVLRHYGYVDSHGNPDPSLFCHEGGGAVNSYADSFNTIRPGGPPPSN